MLYVLFLALAVLYNWWKVKKNKAVLLASLIEAKSTTHREMILSHHFYVFVFEAFLAVIVANFLSDREDVINLLTLGLVYLLLVCAGFFLYRYFIRYLEKHTQLDLMNSFKQYLLKELRVNFALVLLPMLIYTTINLTFQDSVFEEWGSLWFIGFLFNIIFVSVLTIVCTVIIMLKLIPNREISEPEYLEIIQKRLNQINMSGMRVRWIETDIRNAFVVGLKLLFFSNQTMFVGRSLRNMLTLEEFDAVICHELSHVANRHIHKRVIDLLKNFVSIVLGTGFIIMVSFSLSFLYWGEDVILHTESMATVSFMFVVLWFFFNYILLFDNLRSHEFEADAYAVMEMGIDFQIMKAALEKVSDSTDLPDYLKSKLNKKNKSRVTNWIYSKLSTHPSLSERLGLLEMKITRGLPFNYYVSSSRKLRKLFGHIFQWRVAVPATLFFVLFVGWSVFTFKQGQQLITWIHQADPQEIMSNPRVAEKINSYPTIIGHSLMFYIIRKNDEELTKYFLDRGADKGKALVYMVKLQNYETFKKYYVEYQKDLSQDEYFLILRTTAQMNFTEGYRLLVNAQRFEELDIAYKEDITRIHQRHRQPASLKREE